jgi:hypothetical protein
MGTIVRCLFVGVLLSIWSATTQPMVTHEYVCAVKEPWVQACQVDAGCFDYVQFCETYEWRILEDE